MKKTSALSTTLPATLSYTLLAALILALILVLAPQSSRAQDASVNNPVAPNPMVTTPISQGNGLLDGLHVVGGVHSWIDSGRVYELQSPTGRSETSMTEYFFGVKDATGWGIYGQGVEDQTIYPNASMNYFTASDPSISITHPIYASDTFVVTGKFREYFPLSNWAVTNQVYQQAYYLESNLLLKDRWSLFNVLIPRYFSQPRYAPGDTTIFCEDYTYLGKQINPWLRVGVGTHAQIESHFVTPVGKDLDLIPYMDFMLSKSIYAGPRIYFPLYAQNSVFEGDSNVSLSNVQFELYVQAHL